MSVKTNNRPAMYFAGSAAIYYAVVSNNPWLALAAYWITEIIIELAIFTTVNEQEDKA